VYAVISDANSGFISRASDGLTMPSAGLVTFCCGMWMYLALGFSVLIAFNVLIVVVGSVVARHTEPREELDAKQRARLLTYVR